ncbi:MAG: hypothetical protein V3U92_14425 [Cellulophaga sp.]
MKPIKITLFLLLICNIINLHSQESKDYIEFNDRNNVVHGVYLGLAPHYGEINGKDTYLWHLKFAYVANRKFEAGIKVVGFYSNQNLPVIGTKERDLVGVYYGLHFEPILFSKSKVNLSFPLLLGGGVAIYANGDFTHEQIEKQFEKSDVFLVAEPGINALFNISRYLQLEVGIKYRLTNKTKLPPSSLKDISGFSIGTGIKIGVFNMGRNRYKKNIKDDN